MREKIQREYLLGKKNFREKLKENIFFINIALTILKILLFASSGCIWWGLVHALYLLPLFDF